MKLHFWGANRQVTGSRYCLEIGGKRLLVDCGMFQERKFLDRNWNEPPIPAREIDAMLLTHVHIDHSGLIPKLVRDGFRGPIYTTDASAALADVLLRDSAKIQMEDAEYKAKRHRREGRKGPHPEIPLYTTEDVDRCLPLFQSVPYRVPTPILDGVVVTFQDAGHMLGSAMLEVDLTEGHKTRRVVFSGDIGQWNKPIIHDPTLIAQADYLVMESTYGDRNHREAGDIATQLADVVNSTHRRGGNVVIPTFAVERAQELMYFFARLVQAQRIPPMKVYLDSPMAVDVTGIFAQHSDLFDADMNELIAAKVPPLRFPGLTMCRTAEESKRINEVREPCIIMASSGMCNAGRIKHHLRNNLPRPESTILFVGHQGEGTLGRVILDGVSPVRIHGQMYPARARIAQIYGFSGHADRAGLLRWLSHFDNPGHVFFTHGEEDVAVKFCKHVQSQMGLSASVPYYGDQVELD